MKLLNGILLFLLIAPHVALIFAWVSWARAPLKFQPPLWRSILLSLGLLACSLNIATLWLYVLWLTHHRTDSNWWHGRDNFEVVANSLIAFAVLAAILGKGRGRLPLIVAALFGFLVWVIGHIGVL